MFFVGFDCFFTCFLLFFIVFDGFSLIFIRFNSFRLIFHVFIDFDPFLFFLIGFDCFEHDRGRCGWDRVWRALIRTNSYLLRFCQHERGQNLARSEVSTFVRCTCLCEVRLPATLHAIRVKAFMNCAALPELAIPPSLHYIASRAFLDCTAFRRLVKLPGGHRWRGTYAEENAFATCPDMRWPPWLHMIPDTGYVSRVA